jgi:hypothetical protein
LALDTLEVAVKIRVVICVLLAALAMRAVNAGPSPQGQSWTSIARLPNWSGAWTLMGGGRVQAEEAGRYPDNGRVSLTPKYEERRKASAEAHVQSNLSGCLPAGTPGILKHLVMHEYLFTPGRVTIMFEDGELRRIYTDGRKHALLKDLGSSYMGHSIGHWEGRTLVVDTVGFPRGSLWKDFGMLATINTHLVERIFLNDKGEMQIDSVISDPEIFARPYESTSTYQKSPWEMPEAGCSISNRDTGTSVDLTPPPEG